MGLAFFGWILDYSDPFDFINSLYGPDAIGEASNFRDPGIWRRMAAAARLTGEERLRAYARLDRDLARAALPPHRYASAIITHFLSARMGCEVCTRSTASTSRRSASGTRATKNEQATGRPVRRAAGAAPRERR